MKQSRKFRLLPTRRGDPRVSVAAFFLQLAIMFVVVPSFVVPIAFEFLRDDQGRAVTPERISLIPLVPPGTGPSRERPRDGGDNRPVSTDPAAEPAPVLVAPSAVPTGVPASPAAPGRAVEGGTGPLIGGGGPTAGLRPSFNDPRLWSRETDVVEAPLIPLTRADSLQIILNATAEAYLDSLRRFTPDAGRAPGDWTFTRGGKKYGIDPKFIRLGEFSIPTALLALLPMNNAQGNPTAMDRARRLSSFRSEIMEQAERQQRDDDFYSAVKALRERKEKERKEAEAKAQGTVPPDRKE